uniref:Uncharacterized protein n=1 Tax=viral metagenome TaxID=1070528 RepID=A0A6C0AZS6_9ZZZZ
MSLAMYAAPFDNENTQINDKDNDGHIARKRMANNRTQKRVPKENQYSEKVNSVLQSISNLPEQSDSGFNSDSTGLADFHPIPPPMSVGVEQTKLREGQSATPTATPTAMSENKEENYTRFMPNYDKMYKTSATNMPYYSGYNYQQGMNNSTPAMQMQSENSVLLDKLNYMIHLLEEQQDEKTNNVTEEVILYCFLGIFIIFVADSFVRVGKYVR